MPEIAEPKIKPAEPTVREPGFDDFLKKLTSEKETEDPKEPKQYACLLHNDPTTPFWFVTGVLCEVFGLEQSRAEQIMWTVHQSNQPTVVAVFGKDEAETRVDQAMRKVHAQGGLQFHMTAEEAD